MQLTGTLHKIFDEQRVSERFTKREFILKTEEDTDYPQFVKVQLSQKNVDKIIGHRPGDKVQVSINIRGREHNGNQGIQYFNTIEAWKIEKSDAE